MAKSVLLVDDESLVLAVTARGLIEAGYDVITSTNGEAALELMQQRKFDLLITDMVMPGMNGKALTRLVRQQFPNMPILHVTGYEPHTPEDARIPVLMKPFDVDTLIREMCRLLDGSS